MRRWLAQMWPDVALALVGGTAWGTIHGYANAAAGGDSPALVGAIHALAWAALWMAVATHRESIRSRRVAARERSVDLAAPLDRSDRF